MVLGDPASTLPFAIGLGLVLIGAVLLAVGVRGSWWAAELVAACCSALAAA